MILLAVAVGVIVLLLILNNREEPPSSTRGQWINDHLYREAVREARLRALQRR